MEKKYEHSERKGLPGGPNEVFSYVTGVFSEDGYKSYSSDVNNPFNIINSGRITMEDVEFPVMGIDNLGNSEIMMPDGEYEFPGDMVFEIPMAQKGGEPAKQKNWLENYIQSPMYFQRLQNEFPNYTTSQINKEISTRLSNLQNVDVNYPDEPIGKNFGYISGFYDPDKNAIDLEPEYRPESFFPSSGFETIPLHEFGHSVDRAGKQIPEKTKDLIKDAYDGGSDYYNDPSEVINRLMPLRYILEQEGIWNVGSQKFTDSMYDKMLTNPNVINNVHINDILDGLKGDPKQTLKKLLNDIAEFPGDMMFQIPMAQKGGNVSWNWKGKSYSGTLIPSMETETNRYARTHNGKIKTLPKAQFGLFKKGINYIDNIFKTVPKAVDDIPISTTSNITQPSNISITEGLSDYNPFTLASKRKNVKTDIKNNLSLQDDLLEQQSKNRDIIFKNQSRIDKRNRDILYQAGDYVYGLRNKADGLRQADGTRSIFSNTPDPFERSVFIENPFPKYFHDRTGFGSLTSPGFKLTPEGNISANLVANPGSSPKVFEKVGALNTKGDILDFNTGNIFKGNIDSPILGGTEKIIGPKGLISDNIVSSGSYQLNPELTKLYDSNIKFAQDQIPGFKPMGSSLFGRIGVPHVTGDLDGVIIDSDWNKVKNKFTKVDKTKFGDKIKLVTDPSNQGLGNVDVNIIKTGKDGKATGEFATELYRQFFPDEFYKSNEKTLKGLFKDTGFKGKSARSKRRSTNLQLEGKSLSIDKTPQELMNAYDPEVKTILDAFESGTEMGKAKHINRSDLIMEYGDSEKVAKAQELYAKSIMGSNADIGKQFDINAFSDYDNNLKILNKINETGYNVGGGKYLPKDIAKDPAKMQLHLNDWYINNSIYTRRVSSDLGTIDSYDDLVGSYKNWISRGGEAHGAGLNAVKLGEPGANYGDVIGNRQFKLYDDNVSNPIEYIDNVNKQISGSRKVSKDDFSKINDIASKNNINIREGQEINNFGDLLDIRSKAIISDGDKGTKNIKNFLHDVGEEFGMKVITRGRHNMSEYSTILGNIDDTIDNLSISLDKYTPKLKSKGLRETVLKSGIEKLDNKLLTEEIVNVDEITNNFEKVRGYLDGGLEVAEKRYKNLRKLYDEGSDSVKKSLENIKDKYYNKILNKATIEEKRIADEYFKKAEESGDIFTYLARNPIDEVITVKTGRGGVKAEDVVDNKIIGSKSFGTTQKYPVLAKELAFIRQAGEQNLKLKKELNYYNNTLSDLEQRYVRLENVRNQYKRAAAIGTGVGLGFAIYEGIENNPYKGRRSGRRKERLSNKKSGGSLKEERERGGEKNFMKIYKDYIYGKYDGTDMESEAEKVYNKLNRLYRNDAKAARMSIPNYIMTNIFQM